MLNTNLTVQSGPVQKSKAEPIGLLLAAIFLSLYLAARFLPIQAISFMAYWPDVLFYVWLNTYLSIIWWGKRGPSADKDRLTLGQSTMGTTVQVGILATSIFIPLSLTAIQIMVGNTPLAISPSFKNAIANLIVAVFWFGLSTIFGVTTLMYMNEEIRNSHDVLNARIVGIPTNLQFYAMIGGVVRVLWALYLVSVGTGIAFAK